MAGLRVLVPSVGAVAVSAYLDPTVSMWMTPWRLPAWVAPALEDFARDHEDDASRIYRSQLAGTLGAASGLAGLVGFAALGFVQGRGSALRARALHAASLGTCGGALLNLAVPELVLPLAFSDERSVMYPRAFRRFQVYVGRNWDRYAELGGGGDRD